MMKGWSKVILYPTKKQHMQFLKYLEEACCAFWWAYKKEQIAYDTKQSYISTLQLQEAYLQIKKSNEITKLAIQDACELWKLCFYKQQQFPKLAQWKPSFYQKVYLKHGVQGGLCLAGVAEEIKCSFIAYHNLYLVPRIRYDGNNWYMYACIDEAQVIKKQRLEKRKCRIQRSIKRSLKLNHERGLTGKSKNIIKKEQMLLKINRRLCNF